MRAQPRRSDVPSTLVSLRFTPRARNHPIPLNFFSFFPSFPRRRSLSLENSSLFFSFFSPSFFHYRCPTFTPPYPNSTPDALPARARDFGYQIAVTKEYHLSFFTHFFIFTFFKSWKARLHRESRSRVSSVLYQFHY